MLKPETIKEIESLATEMAGIFTPPELIVGCEVLSVADRDQYAVNNGWIEARVGKHNRQRCRWRGQFANVKVADYVDVLFFASYRLFVVLNQGGTSAVTAILNNYTATAAPTVDDDSGDGYSVGSAWIDVTADKAYICLGATVGAAVWEEIGGSGLAGGVWLIHSTTITIYATITLAVADYAAGDTIMILPGTYSENFTFTSAITLIGTDRDTCIITSTATATIATRADVTLENLTIQNTGTAAQQIALHINSASSDEGTVIARRCNFVGDVNTSLGSRAVRCEAGTGHQLVDCNLSVANADGTSTDDEGLSVGGGTVEVYGGTVDGIDQDVQVYNAAGATVKLFDPVLVNNLIAITSVGVGHGWYFDADGKRYTVNSTTALTNLIPTANANDVFRYNTLSNSDFVATIATLPGGANFTYNAPSSGTGANLVPASTSQLAKMVLHNTTRGTDALISNCVTGTSTITLTANVPVGWQVGDTITIRSQTNTDIIDAVAYFVDFELTSGVPLNVTKYILGILSIRDTGAAGIYVQSHPYEAGSASKRMAIPTQVANIVFSTGIPPLQIISNRFCYSWRASGSGTTLAKLSLFGYGVY